MASHMSMQLPTDDVAAGFNHYNAEISAVIAELRNLDLKTLTVDAVRAQTDALAEINISMRGFVTRLELELMQGWPHDHSH